MSAPLADRLRALAASWRKRAAISLRYAAHQAELPAPEVLAVRGEAMRAHMLECLATELEQALAGEQS